MGLLQIAAAGGIIFFAAMAQSAVGFGFALFAIPLLVWVGMPLPGAVTLAATCSMLQALIGVRKLRASVPWHLSLTATAVRLVSVVLGLFLLKRLADLNPEHIRAVVGTVLCVLVAAQCFWRPHAVKALHWGWGGLAFLSSGFIAGVCGMGGPPLVLWSMAHDWSAQKTRGFLFAVFATSIPVQIVLLAMTFGASILLNVIIGVAFLPLVYLGSAVGLPTGNRMEKERLRAIAYGLLFVIGLSAVFPVAVGLLR